MLNHIRIRNYAIIDHLELECAAGMTALTGETGAGKSILLGALGLLLGDRADSDNVRAGSSKAEISAEFDISDMEHIKRWLKDKELDSEGDCLIRRRLSSDGRSRAFVNGSPVPLNDIRELGEMLVDIHGQHEHQSLMKPQVQRQLLDDYAGNRKLLDSLKQTYQQWHTVSENLQQLQMSSSERNDRIDLLRYQVNELDKLGLEEDEYRHINDEHKRLANTDRLVEACQSVLQALYDADDETLYAGLSQQLSRMEYAIETDNQLAPVDTMLNEALVQVEESAGLLRDYLSSLEMDPERFQELEQRLGTIHDLARKHHVDPNQLYASHQQLAEELDQLDHGEENLEQLQQQVDTLQQAYNEQSQALSKARKKTAKKLGQLITAAMQTLGMAGGVFEIAVDFASDAKFTAQGQDRIEFMVSANPGQNCKPLAKVASGGELSRISLAIQMITATQGRIPTLVFDEVDSGVGGGIAEIVGKHLRELGNNRQVFCVTHLPQVASQAHHHFKVQKRAEAGNTITEIVPLSELQRVEEISRMLGGVEITEQTRAHASEMLTRAQAG